MPKLYYTPTSCGASSFIAAYTANVRIETEQVEFDAQHVKRWTKVGKVDFYSVNPKGNVPTLVLDDGTVLNENIASLQYIADLVSRPIKYIIASFIRFIGSWYDCTSSGYSGACCVGERVELHCI